LKPRAVVARRIQARECELCGDVFGGKIASARAHTSAFQQIAGKESDVRAHALR